MEVEKSLLGVEIDKIVNRPNNNTNEVMHEVHIHTVDIDVKIDKVTSIDIMEDYNNNYSAEIYVNILCPMGDLVKLIYPYRNNLEMSVIRTLGTFKDMERYKLILMNVNTDLGSGKYTEKSLEELNKEEYVNLKCQCISREVEAIRLSQVCGIYRGHTVKDIIIGLFDKNCRDIKVNGMALDPYITMSDVDNDRIYEHIIIPSGTKLVDLPSFLQELDYGVYNGEIGMYIKNERLGTFFNRCDLGSTAIPCKKVLSIYIYQLYRISEKNKKVNKLIIYGSPNHKYSMIENTYLIDGDDIKILSNEDSVKINTGDTALIDNGTGYITLDVNKVMNRPVIVNPDKVDSFKDLSNIDSYSKERADTSVYRMTKEPNDNQYNYRSAFVKESGDILQIKWNFSNPKYLIPGMSITYAYLGDNNDVIRVDGVLQSHFTSFNNSAKMASTILNVFVEKSKKEVN